MKTICPLCNGSKVVPRFGGTGPRVEDRFQTCPNCHGDGRVGERAASDIPVTSEPCPKCNGSGKAGFIEQVLPNWSGNLNLTHGKCTACRGTGYRHLR